jgi:hypothetical protein
VKSRRGLCIIGLDAGPCIIEFLSFVFASAMFVNLENFTIYVSLS